jgi:hypothetical protein
MPTTHTIEGALSTGDGRQKFGALSLSVPDGGTSRTVGAVGVLQETFARAAFTDGGATVGTVQFAGSLPAGAVVLATKVLVGLGFTGDTSAAMTIGDGSDVDRYNTSTIDLFTTAATGVQSGVPSGTKLLTAENRPTVTVTSAADFTNVAAGSVTIAIYYIQA